MNKYLLVLILIFIFSCSKEPLNPTNKANSPDAPPKGKIYASVSNGMQSLWLLDLQAEDVFFEDLGPGDVHDYKQVNQTGVRVQFDVVITNVNGATSQQHTLGTFYPLTNYDLTASNYFWLLYPFFDNNPIFAGQEYRFNILFNSEPIQQ